MYLEQLPNELLFELFEYFHLVDLFRAFYRLNLRFNRLLFDYNQQYHLDLRSISKHDTEIVCKDYLPLVNQRIISIRLSDDVETPISSEIFFASTFTFDQYVRLQSLSLYHICSLSRTYEILSQCQHMSRLRHLSFIKCNFWQDDKDFQYFINTIWTLPKLTHCTLDYTIPGHRLLTQISSVSQSIECISMKDIHCNFRALSHLFEHTPKLRRLQTTIFCGCSDEQIHTTNPSSIVALNIVQKSSLNSMINLFQKMTNLRYLTLETNYIYLNGLEWKKILTEHLPTIRKFRLRMFFELSSLRSREEQVDMLLNSFRIPFWIRKYQCFVQCDWTMSKTQKHAVLYTLPYSFQHFLFDNLCQSKSTCPNNRIHRSYDQVTHSQYLEYENSLISNGLRPCSIQCTNIQRLEVRLPFNDKIFYSLVPTLAQLTSLDVILNNNFAYYQLQAILDRAPRLYSLTFRCLQNLPSALFRLTSASIRRLDFITTSTLRCGHFKKFECEALGECVLGQSCHVLLVKVQNRANILHLIQIMPNLRSMIVQCEDENPQTDELLKWLRVNLPSACSVERDRDDLSKMETLANELLLDLFEYFNGIDLLRGFLGLNSRFDSLLSVHFYKYRFDLRSISKHDFDFLCHHYLPSLIHRITSLKLSNDDETPNLPDFFLSYGFTLNKFIRLQSLSLYSIQSFNQLNQILFQCHQLPYLTHLYLIDGYNDDERKDIPFLFNNIWNLSKLQHLFINYNTSGKTWLKQMTGKSLSIRYLSMENIACSLEDTTHLVRQTPNLQYLNATIHANDNDERVFVIPSSIVS
ncbi:unnamed protein product, partial [Adineta ricciae]